MEEDPYKPTPLVIAAMNVAAFIFLFGLVCGLMIFLLRATGIQ